MNNYFNQSNQVTPDVYSLLDECYKNQVTSTINETTCLDNHDTVDDQLNFYPHKKLDYPEFDMSFLSTYHLYDFESSED